MVYSHDVNPHWLHRDTQQGPYRPETQTLNVVLGDGTSTDHHGQRAESSQRSILCLLKSKPFSRAQNARTGGPLSSRWGATEVSKSAHRTARATLQSVQLRAVRKTALNRRDCKGRDPAGNCRENPGELNIDCSSKKRKAATQRAFRSHRTGVQKALPSLRRLGSKGSSG